MTLREGERDDNRRRLSGQDMDPVFILNPTFACATSSLKNGKSRLACVDSFVERPIVVR